MLVFLFGGPYCQNHIHLPNTRWVSLQHYLVRLVQVSSNLYIYTRFQVPMLYDQVKAWVADKDAEALRCQKLLVEEEEAAKKR